MLTSPLCVVNKKCFSGGFVYLSMEACFAKMNIISNDTGKYKVEHAHRVVPRILKETFCFKWSACRTTSVPFMMVFLLPQGITCSSTETQTEAQCALCQGSIKTSLSSQLLPNFILLPNDGLSDRNITNMQLYKDDRKSWIFPWINTSWKLHWKCDVLNLNQERETCYIKE